MIRVLFVFILLSQSYFAIQRRGFTPRAREFKYMNPRVVSLKQHKIYGKEYVDIYFKFNSKVNLDKMDLKIVTAQEKGVILYQGKIHKKGLEIPIAFKKNMAKIQFRILKKESFGLISFKLEANYDYPVDRVLEYIADRHKSDYLVDSARFKLIESVKKKEGDAQNVFSLNLYG
ncbi:hypothetical protein MJH12_16610, partial [bacterium]|nr:hypothetical protein [bacterium]